MERKYTRKQLEAMIENGKAVKVFVERICRNYIMDYDYSGNTPRTVEFWSKLLDVYVRDMNIYGQKDYRFAYVGTVTLNRIGNILYHL